MSWGRDPGGVLLRITVVALIVTLMLSEPAGTESTLARDTALAAVMITCNGVVGLSLLMGPLRHGCSASAPRAPAAPSVLAPLATLSLVLPAFTTSESGPSYAGSQLAFAGTASLILYGVFVFVQTVRHRDYFLPLDARGEGRARHRTGTPGGGGPGPAGRLPGRRGRAGQDGVAGERGR